MVAFTPSVDHPTARVDKAVKEEVRLTPTQKRVLALISDNLRNKQIAFALDITEATVKVHVSAILKRLGLTNRGEARFHFQAHYTVQACELRAEL